MCSTLTYLEHYTEHVHTYDASGRVGRCSRGVQRSREHALEHYISEYSAEPKTYPTKPYMHNLVMCSKIDIKQNKTTTTNQKTSRTLVFFSPSFRSFPSLPKGVSSTVLLGGPLRYFYRYWSTPENLVAKKVIIFIETYQISQNHTPQFIFQLHLYSGGVWPLSPPLDTPLP